MPPSDISRPPSQPSNDPEDLARALEELAREAGAAILAVKGRGLKAHTKRDGSPVTDADLAAEAVIASGLARLLPHLPVISEEGSACPPLLDDPEAAFLLVDPLDGTREFLAGSGDYTVNIALIVARKPVLGVVHLPEASQSWVGDLRGKSDGAWHSPASSEFRRIQTRRAMLPVAIMASHRHLDPKTKGLLDRLGSHHVIRRGSSIKFCVIAAGEADFYPRFGPTMEWDTAAGQAVLCAAGGIMLDVSGAPFEYGKVAKGCLNGGFFAMGDPNLQRLVSDDLL